MRLILCLIATLGPSAFGATEAVWVWPHAYFQAHEKQGEVFLLQRHFPKNGESVGRGPSPHEWPNATLHLVFRLEREPRPQEIIDAYSRLKRAWEQFGTHVAGLQLDYDSPTGQLGKYGKTLAEIKKLLPSGTELSVTGLPDWFRVADSGLPPGVSVFYQLYRGSHAQSRLEEYLRASARCSHPFRIGLLEQQQLNPAQQKILSQNKYFHGTVRFLGAKR